MDSLPGVNLLVIFITSLWSVGTDAAVLNDYILDYQPLQFNPLHLHEKHSRVKREIDPYLRWNFKAYGRSFNLQLKPSKSVFAPDHTLMVDSEPPQTVDTSFIYEGIIAGEPSSSVHLAIIDGSASGHIMVPGHTTYHIEPARKWLNDSTFHTIIYPESRMNLDPYRHKRGSYGSYGSKELYEKLGQMWTPVEEKSSSRKRREASMNTSPYNKYSAEANLGHLNRKKRADAGFDGLLQQDKKTCFMSLQADQLLYNQILSKFSASDSDRVIKAKEEILSMFTSHIKALNDIYENTRFERTGDSTVFARGIRFQLQRSVIITQCDNTWASGYCNDNLDVSNFLDLTAQRNQSDFCLVHTFTYRDFTGGTLGLAWVATPGSQNAGVCGRYSKVRDSNNGVSDRSLNTGIVTLINFRQQVPPRVSQLTFAHEVGHNFGSTHDTTDVCAPYGTNQPNAAQGNYIMFPSATQGNLPNNDDFSPCSKDLIAQVLERLAPAGSRKYCFKSSEAAFCGNNIVEKGEECDCGYEGSCTDQCCKGRKEDSSEGCTYDGNVVCSPSEGKCCRGDCDFESANKQCADATDCTGESQCTGNNATCPEPSHKPDYETFCNNYGKVCITGECIGSVCQNIGWMECFATSKDGATEEQMCYVSCRKDANSECISSFDEAKVNQNSVFKQLLQNISDNRQNSDGSLGVKRPAGSACNDYKGYCDMFSKCRNVDAEGPFKQLTDLIFDPVTLKNVKTWIEDHWWAVLLMCVGVIVFMGVFVKIFGYNTPSKRPGTSDRPPPRGRPQPGPRPAANKPYGNAVSQLQTGNEFHYDNKGYRDNESNPGYYSMAHSSTSSRPR